MKECVFEMLRKKVSLVDLVDILKARYNESQIKLIQDFLMYYLGQDINVLEDGEFFNTLSRMSIISEDGKILGLEVTYVPRMVLLEKISNYCPVDYKACSRRIIFRDDGGFTLESCECDFDIHVSDEVDDTYRTDQQLNYNVAVNEWSYDFSGVMVSSFYGVKRRTLKRIGLDSVVPISEIISCKNKCGTVDEKIVNIQYGKENFREDLPNVKIHSHISSDDESVENVFGDYIIDYDYYKLFDEGFEMLEKGLTDFSDRRVILLVECNRLSHDVASIEILKGIYTVPTRFFAYFNLSGEYAIDLPDITFPLHVDHSAYDQHFVVYPKPIEVCKQEIDMMVARKIIDEIQGNVLLNLCNDNCRDLLMSYGFSYGTIKRFSKNDGIKK